MTNGDETRFYDQWPPPFSNILEIFRINTPKKALIASMVIWFITSGFFLSIAIKLLFPKKFNH